MKMIQDEEEFNKALADAADKLVVVDFTAAWCGPCKAIAPFYEELATKEPNVVFLKVDVDDNEEVTGRFQVSSMPTFVFIKNGNEVDRFSGASKDKLTEYVNKLK